MLTDAHTLTYACRWLEEVADASAKGEVTLEMELPDGRFLVAEEWPSRVDYVEHVRNRHAIEAMVDLDRRARCQG
jgi:hypothetical protein